MEIEELIDERFLGIYLFDFFKRNKRKLVLIFLFGIVLGSFIFKKQNNNENYKTQWRAEVLIVPAKNMFVEKDEVGIRNFETSLIATSEVLLPIYKNIKNNTIIKKSSPHGDISYSDWIARIGYQTSNISDLILSYEGFSKYEVEFVLNKIIKNYKNIDENVRFARINKINKYLDEAKITFKEKIIDSELKLQSLKLSQKNEVNQEEKTRLENNIKFYYLRLNRIEDEFLKYDLNKYLNKYPILEITEPLLTKKINNISPLEDVKIISILTFSIFILFLTTFLMIIIDRYRDKLFLKEEIKILFPYNYLFSLPINLKEDLEKKEDYLSKFLVNSNEKLQIFYLGKKNKKFIEEISQSLKKQIKGINQLIINDVNNIDPNEKVLFFFGSDDIRRGDIDSIKEYLALFDISVLGWVFIQN